MPVATGRLRAIAFGKYAAAVLAHALAAGVLAQTTGSPSWNDLGVKWEPDFTWGGDSFSKSRTRMAADARGNLFVTQGDSLYVGSIDGTEWKTAPIITNVGSWRHTPIILGPNGTMIWGAWTSRNWGSSWVGEPSETSIYGYSTAAIAPSGYFLTGSTYDAIHRADNPAAKPVQVHFGHTFGSIIDFAVSASGKAYAAPDVDDLLVSRDGGKTWVEKPTVLKSDPYAPKSGDLASGLLALEAAYPEESLWMARGRWGEKAQVVEYVWSGDSLVARRHANVQAPDSALTSLQVQRLASGGIALWLGTWGQGVYRSLDRGESWHPVNTALGHMQVEGLVLGLNGRVFALTPRGLYSISGSALALAPRGGSRKERSGADGRIMGFAPVSGVAGFASPEGRVFGADGRMLFAAPPSDRKSPSASRPR